MKIQLEADFSSRYVFQPVYSMEGKLLAVEMLSRFNSLDDDLTLPVGIGINLLSPEQRIELFNEQLILAHRYAAWFSKHDVLLTINIEEAVVESILSDQQMRQRIAHCPFIAFEISEGFPNLSAGKNNESVSRLSEMFMLCLDNFGSGQATLTALYDGLFDYVKIDKRFYWQLFTHQGYDVVIDALLKNINLLCKGVIVGGIERKEYFNKLRHAGVFGLQGFLWPSVGVDSLQALQAMPGEFNNTKG